MAYELELVALEDVLDRLRVELGALRRKSEDNKEALRFELDAVELEFDVAVKRGGKGGAKASLYVVEFSTEGQKEVTRTQKLRLKMTPTVGDTGGASGKLKLGRG